MNQRTRRLAFFVVAFAVLATAALLAGLSSPREKRLERAGPSAATEPAPLTRSTDRQSPRIGATQPAPVPEPRNPAGGRVALRGAERQGLRFLAAFLRYQGGRADLRTRQAIRATATHRVARYLLARIPTKAGRGRGGARLVRVDFYGPWRGRAKGSAELAYTGIGQHSLFEFALGRRGRGWRLVELYPEGR